jgi:hypothetical protein
MNTGGQPRSLRLSHNGPQVSLLKLGLFLLWVSFCLLLLFISAFGWWVLLVLALPIHALAQWIGDRVFADKYGWSTEQVGFSVKRIASSTLSIEFERRDISCS